MLNGSMHTPQRQSETSRIALIAGLGVGAFVLGIVITLGIVQLNSQKAQIAQMNEMVAQMAQQRDADQDVTRTVATDLLSVTAQAPAPAPVAPVAAAAPAAQPTSPAELVQLAVAAGTTTPMQAAPSVPEAVTAAVSPDSTADKIRSLVNAAVAPQANTTNIDAETLANARKFETLAIIQAGVQQLVTAVVNGQYDIHTNYEDEDFSGRIHFAFVGHEEDQTELERLLANAAEAGIVKHSNAVVDGNGRVNGHILLFDLVERALENGTLEEQRAGAEMMRKAQEMLAKDVVVGEPENAQGEKFYVVEPGDSLAYIALQFYGNTNDYTRIYEANRGQISQPNDIRVGQRLRIPSA
ncbi:LysM peptidoglycan-binding domain-containing protein [uncultured Sulfitobacter sp.]|uniref:LysM peptidoglycan-binding domain-containing protein n=1 Tax=uncultured Sulfitobacter sp. TaxID=191468 RepID=UPI00261AFD8B|nr:LysM peptidoglycan-binding domain-containing protein [uncultured Sulfitobacter sp.]